MDREKLYFLIKGSIYLLLIIYDRDLIFRGLSSFYTFEGIFIFVVADDRRELNLIFFFSLMIRNKDFIRAFVGTKFLNIFERIFIFADKIIDRGDCV